MTEVSREMEMRNMMERIQIDQLDMFFDDYDDVFSEKQNSFSQFMRKKFREKNVSQKEVFQKANIPTRYGYKLIAEEKKSKQRDVILRLGFSLHMNINEMQRALVLAGFMELNPFNKRDIILLVLINNGIYSIDKVNAYLTKYREKELYCCSATERTDNEEI